VWSGLLAARTLPDLLRLIRPHPVMESAGKMYVQGHGPGAGMAYSASGLDALTRGAASCRSCQRSAPRQPPAPPRWLSSPSSPRRPI
jgi:hypothetical protein